MSYWVTNVRDSDELSALIEYNSSCRHHTHKVWERLCLNEEALEIACCHCHYHHLEMGSDDIRWNKLDSAES